MTYYSFNFSLAYHDYLWFCAFAFFYSNFLKIFLVSFYLIHLVLVILVLQLKPKLIAKAMFIILV